MLDFIKFIFWTFVVLFVIVTAPFVVCHVIDHWDDPSYPHSGFTPESPTWQEPEDDWAFHNVR